MIFVVKAMAYGLIFALAIGVAAIMLRVRFAPDIPARWHVSVATTDIGQAGPCVDQIKTVHLGARATCLLDRSPAAVLASLNAIALNTPRTKRLAGQPSDLRITWVSRSRIIGFPDYVTAEVAASGSGTRLDIFSRQRYGDGDAGVNAARLTAWLTALDQT